MNLQKRSNILIFLLPVFLLSILIAEFFIRNGLQNDISQKKARNAFIAYSSKAYPVFKKSVLGASTLQTFFPDMSKDLGQITAGAAVIMDAKTKTVIMAKNERLRFSMASTTKIMTALIGLSYFKLDDILTVKTENIEGAVVGLKIGEKMTFKNLLYAMLLPSGNDAAFTIAQNYPGGEVAFVKAMNKKAQELYLLNTHFSDPAGLTDEEDYTTPIELARLAATALENTIFSKIVSTRQTIITTIDTKRVFPIANLNKLLDLEGVNGIKTGYTEIAGEVLVTSKIQDGHGVILVVMKSKDRFSDTKYLLKLVSNNLLYHTVSFASE